MDTSSDRPLPRRMGLGILLLLCALASAREGRAVPPAEPGVHPNVVLVLVDDLGWSDLGCYGSDLHSTPNIDRLASEGVRFTAAYAAAPVCSPTRASIMTGKYPARLHMTVWYEASSDPPRDRKVVPPVTVGNLPHQETTIAEALKPAGYLAFHVGKWHLGEASHYPETQGFDVNIGGTFWGAPSTFFYPYRGLWSRSTELRYVPHLEWGREGEYLTDRLTDEAIRLVDRSGDRPFFLHLAYHTVHTPIEAKAGDVERYRQALRPSHRHQNPVYAAMVHSLDENVGRLLARLDDLKLRDRTAVILVSDNGGYVNDYRGTRVTTNHPLRSGKGSLYEGGIRVPLIVRWPGVTRPGAVCDAPVISNDLFPTVLDVAGVPGPEHDGRSLRPWLEDPRAERPERPLFWHYPHYYPTTTPVSAVRMGDWKLLEYLEDGRVELYNLGEDLEETRDLAATRPEKATELRRELHSWRKTVDAQMPAPRGGG